MPIARSLYRPGALFCAVGVSRSHVLNEAPTARMELKPGDKLGPYKIVSAIGKGRMGEVRKTRDPQPGPEVAIDVAIKVFRAAARLALQACSRKKYI